MRKARKMVQLLVSTLEGLKSEKSFNELWQISHKKAEDLKSFVEEDDNLEVYFDLEEAKIPRKLKWTKSPTRGILSGQSLRGFPEQNHRGAECPILGQGQRYSD